jgi:tryptophan synthase alpha chain
VDAHPEVRRVQLVAPTTSDRRVAAAAAATDGWLYLVTRTGITGPRDDLSPDLAELARRARATTELPLYAGFGIATAEHAVAALRHTDGVVVGSAAVRAAADGGAPAVFDLVSGIRAAIDGGPLTNRRRSRMLRAP